MTNSKNPTSAKCFSVILRRLLCTGSLPTHPSDHLTEFGTAQFDSPNEALKTEALKTEAQVQATPGLVARLMGLDSLPPELNWVPKQRTLDSITRSRSVNSVDYFPLQFDLTQEAQHRRIRTSVSFREVPTFLHPRNRDFLVLCFDKADETKEEGLNVRKHEEKKVERTRNKGNVGEKMVVKKKENQQQNKNKSSYCKRKEEPKRVSVKPSSKIDVVLARKKDDYRKPSPSLKAKSPVKNLKEVSIRLKHAKKRENRCGDKTVEAEGSSVKSSPVSAFDLHDSPIRVESPVSEESRLMGMNSRKKSSTKINKYEYPCREFIRVSNADDQEHRAINKKFLKTTRENDYYMKMLIEVCRLAEEDTKGSSLIGIETFKFEDCEEICNEFGQQILELLMNQVVDELCGASHHHVKKSLAV